MIEYRIGDLLATDAEALVNTVNCVGHMGRGVAPLSDAMAIDALRMMDVIITAQGLHNQLIVTLTHFLIDIS